MSTPTLSDSSLQSNEKFHLHVEEAQSLTCVAIKEPMFQGCQRHSSLPRTLVLAEKGFNTIVNAQRNILLRVKIFYKN